VANFDDKRKYLPPAGARVNARPQVTRGPAPAPSPLAGRLGLAASTRANTAQPGRAPAYFRGDQSDTQDWQTGERHTTVAQPRGHFTTIAGPRNDAGNPLVFTNSQNAGWAAGIEFDDDTGRDIVGTVYIYPEETDNAVVPGSPGQPPPWSVPPVLVGMSANRPQGGCMPLVRFQHGHKGVMDDIFFNMTPGAVQKIGCNGNSAKIGFGVTPMFYIADDTVGTHRVYDIAPGERLTATKWNLPNSNLTARLANAVNPDLQAGILTLPATGMAYFSSGSGFVDSASRPFRTFLGSVPLDASANHSFVECPVSWHCASFQLDAGGIDGAGAAYTLVAYQAIRGISGTPPQGLIGPFLSGATIPLIPGVDRIFVVSAAASSGTGSEPLFSIQYFIGL
jgi:hypothetical protein